MAKTEVRLQYGMEVIMYGWILRFVYVYDWEYIAHLWYMNIAQAFKPWIIVLID